MSYQQYRDRELRYYQDRVHQLEQENLLLRSSQPQIGSHYHSHYHQNVDPYANSVLELQSRNEKLEREAQLYQMEIKRELTDFIRESNLLKECTFRRKYINSLSYPPPKVIGLRR